MPKEVILLVNQSGSMSHPVEGMTFQFGDGNPVDDDDMDDDNDYLSDSDDSNNSSESENWSQTSSDIESTNSNETTSSQGSEDREEHLGPHSDQDAEAKASADIHEESNKLIDNADVVSETSSTTLPLPRSHTDKKSNTTEHQMTPESLDTTLSAAPTNEENIEDTMNRRYGKRRSGYQLRLRKKPRYVLTQKEIIINKVAANNNAL